MKAELLKLLRPDFHLVPTDSPHGFADWLCENLGASQEKHPIHPFVQIPGFDIPCKLVPKQRPSLDFDYLAIKVPKANFSAMIEALIECNCSIVKGEGHYRVFLVGFDLGYIHLAYRD